ncbi:hypothetical protein ACFQ9X_45545 [Catenulispora yoronensis]
MVAGILDRWFGEDPELWLAAIARAGSWGGTVPALIESVALHEDRGEYDRIPGHAKDEGRAPRWPRGIDASAVLLAMAPPTLVDLFLDQCASSEPSRGILTRVMDRGPIVPKLVAYALGGEKSTPAMLQAYFRNPGMLAAGLRERVLRKPADVEVLQEVYLDSAADRTLRVGCVRRAEAAGGFEPGFRDGLVRGRFRDGSVSGGSVGDEDDTRLMEPLLASGDPVLVHWLLKRLNSRLSLPALRWAGYATLARTAGPEPVWALEQERVGRLEKMAGPVRASMADGDIAPILAAAEAVPLTIGVPGTAMELGAPMIEPWPYTDLISEHVEGNPRRLKAVALLRDWVD